MTPDSKSYGLDLRLNDTPERPGPHDSQCRTTLRHRHGRRAVDEISTRRCDGDTVCGVARDQTRFILDDVRLALDDAGSERQSDGDIRAVDADVVIGRQGRVIAADSSLDGIDAVPRRWRSR